MRFIFPEFLWLAVLSAIALVVFNVWSARRRRVLIARFVNARLLESLTVGVSNRFRKIKNGFLIAGVCLVMVALARPQWGRSEEKALRRGVDICIAMDTSKSLWAKDLTPNRFERMKLAIQDLVDTARGSRFALVPFAGTAFLQAPLTLDRNAFLESLKTVEVGIIPQGGSSLSDAIRVGQTAFREDSANHRVLVIFSDGEDHEGGVERAARLAADEGVQVFTVGVGTAAGEILQTTNEEGRVQFVRDRAGSPVRSQLNEGLLRSIAERGGGFYVSLSEVDSMQVLFEQGIDALPKAEFETGSINARKERYQWPLALGTLFVILEYFIPDRGMRWRLPWRRKAPATAASALLAFSLLAPIDAEAVSPNKAKRFYQEGEYESAMAIYEEMMRDGADDPRLAFNAAATAYQMGDLEKAYALFDRALLADDLELQQKAYYGQANTYYRMGDLAPDPETKLESWKTSLKRYESALTLNPEDAVAQHNHEFVRQRIQDLQQQNQDQQNEDSSSEDEGESESESESDPQSGEESEPESQENPEESEDGQDEEMPSEGDESDSDMDQSGEEPEEQESSPEPQEGSEEEEPTEESEDDEPQEQEAEDPEPQPEDQPQDSEDSEDAESSPSDGSEPAESTPTPGEMTLEQAQELLDQFRANEAMLPFLPTNAATASSREVKDW